MALIPGTKLGPYEIVALLGAGGMGEVYRARDTKLGRDVALKLLPQVFTTDADRVTRFKREARVLASLNHPHIGAIYGFEDAGDMPALVLELVEGPTLDDRVRRGPLPLPEAFSGRSRQRPANGVRLPILANARRSSPAACLGLPTGALSWPRSPRAIPTSLC
jgi:Protein kinase domain